MTEEKSVLVERAEAALSKLPLPEPDWDAFASRIEGAVGSAPAEDATLFDAPLPATDDDGETPVTAPADDALPVSGEIAAPVAAAAEAAGPTLSVAPASSDNVERRWVVRAGNDRSAARGLVGQRLRRGEHRSDRSRRSRGSHGARVERRLGTRRIGRARRVAARTRESCQSRACEHRSPWLCGKSEHRQGVACRRVAVARAGRPGRAARASGGVVFPTGFAERRPAAAERATRRRSATR